MHDVRSVLNVKTKARKTFCYNLSILTRQSLNLNVQIYSPSVWKTTNKIQLSVNWFRNFRMTHAQQSS
jgi:hypothetical protein